MKAGQVYLFKLLNKHRYFFVLFCLISIMKI
jgi:hypothetical protein